MYNKNKKQIVTILSEIEINGEQIEVKFTGKCREVDNGIGRYEFHGCIGFDSQPGLEVEEISWDKTLYSDNVNSSIDIYLNNNEDDIMNTMSEKYEPEDYPEPDYESNLPVYP